MVKDWFLPLKEKSNTRRLLITFLFIGLIGFGWGMYSAPTIKWLYALLTMSIVYVIVIFWILINLRKHHKDSNLKKQTEDVHFFCADPLCSRCKGYWVGLSGTTSIILTLYQDIISLFFSQGTNPWLLIGLGSVIFLLSTPINGAIRSLFRSFIKRFDLPETQQNWTKIALGFTSGLSLSVITLGVLMVI